MSHLHERKFTQKEKDNFNGDDKTQNSKSSQMAHGYLEKDWGTNFPQTWIWIHANHFESDSDVSVTIALASVPVWGDSILTRPGLLSGVYINNTLYSLSNPTWSFVNALKIEDDEEWRTITIKVSSLWKTQRLEIIAKVPNVYRLEKEERMKRYPHVWMPDKNGAMSPHLMEFVNASVSMRFEDDDTDLVFQSTSYPATVECHGEPGEDDMQFLLSIFGQ